MRVGHREMARASASPSRSAPPQERLRRASYVPEGCGSGRVAKHSRGVFKLTKINEVQTLCERPCIYVRKESSSLSTSKRCLCLFPKEKKENEGTDVCRRRFVTFRNFCRPCSIVRFDAIRLARETELRPDACISRPLGLRYYATLMQAIPDEFPEWHFPARHVSPFAP